MVGGGVVGPPSSQVLWALGGLSQSRNHTGGYRSLEHAQGALGLFLSHPSRAHPDLPP
jgi:hypothetical protein